MNAARRRFIQRTLGVVGFIAAAVAVVPVVAVGSVYAYRVIAAHRAAASVTRAKVEPELFVGPCQPPERMVGGGTIIHECDLDPEVPPAGFLTDAEMDRLERLEAAEKARDGTRTLLLPAALLSLAPLAVSVVLLWTRHFLALGGAQE